MDASRAEAPGQNTPQASPPNGAGPEDEAGHPHNFAAQKELHQQIRNDPDYDDWEYGTEPLPQEAWPVPRPETDRC